MSYANLLLNVLYHIVIEMNIREFCLQTGTFIYKPGISVTKQDFHLQMGILGLQMGFSGYYSPTVFIDTGKISRNKFIDTEIICTHNMIVYHITITRLFTVLKSGASLPITINIKTSSKTGFTPVCYSFDDYNIFFSCAIATSYRTNGRNVMLYFIFQTG